MMTVAFRVKGLVQPIEGKLIEVADLDIAVRHEDDTVIGTTEEYIEAVWFLYKWMSWEEFKTLQ